MAISEDARRVGNPLGPLDPDAPPFRPQTPRQPLDSPKWLFLFTPHNGRMRRMASENLPKFGPYKVAARPPFSDEILPP